MAARDPPGDGTQLARLTAAWARVTAAQQRVAIATAALAVHVDAADQARNDELERATAEFDAAVAALNAIQRKAGRE